MRKATLALGSTGATLLMFATGASAQSEPADAFHVAEALKACQEITTPDWIHLKDLEAMEWKEAERRGTRRRVVTVRGVYEKRGNPTYMFVGKQQLDDKTCVITARLEETSDYIPLLQNLSGLIGMPSGQDNFTYFWTIDSKQIRVEPAGEKSAPLARFTVRAIAKESEE